MPVCDRCGKFVKDLRRHKARGRCKVKGRRKTESSWPVSYEKNLEKLKYGFGGDTSAT